MHCLFCILLTVRLGCALPAGAEKTVDYPDPNRWAGEMKTFADWDAKNTPPQNAVVFVGSSSIRLWKTAEAFSGLPVINRGFGGSWMADSVCFADRLILRYKPAVVVIYAGDNDIAGGLPPEQVHRDFVRLTQIIHAELPRTPIICLPVKPSRSRWTLWPKMQQVNQLNRQYAQTAGYILYVDTASVLLGGDGLPDETLFEPDALHLNQKGYDQWNRLLRPVLNRLYPADAPPAAQLHEAPAQE
ncbi:MAG TPA: SGNH/GDSL hydrolase family protein [Anaerohalosphaeraceae bacterium]|nr:hypothetical protein [Phycisphaerae bacterium]HOL31385.1 SGNH/GDSL hydrolase family protein [Anaerohalosphaeraceae bacterium]HPO70284.1 SGNH/GDSL hydrolase family protein [Anaerohalosphaeraceae bacterium]